MASEGGPRHSQPPLVDNILQYGKLAFDPDVPEETRKANKPKFDELLVGTGTLALMPALNLLVQPNRTPPWLRQPLIHNLALLPLRPRGVEHTIEFILSVHPSSANGSTSTSTGRGSNISLEALNAASKLLSSPPNGMSPEDWFFGIAPQLLSLLDGDGEPGMDKASAYIIGFGVLGRRQYGAPGTPGWKALVDPMLQSIDPSTAPQSAQLTIVDSTPEVIITTLGAAEILVPSSGVAKALARLLSLVTSHPHPSLTKRLLRPIILPLWSLSSWPSDDANCAENYRKPARILLQTFLQLASSKQQVDKLTNDLASKSKLLASILQNLMFRGRTVASLLCWMYTQARDGGVQIEKMPSHRQRSPVAEINIEAVEYATKSFVDLLKSGADVDEISQIFLKLCNKWLMNDENVSQPQIITQVDQQDSEDDASQSLIEAKLMQTMMNDVPDKLVGDSKQVLDLVSKVLLNFNASKGGTSNEEVATIALSLLNIVLTSTTFRAGAEVDTVLETIQSSLEIIRKTQLEISSTARNMLLLLRFRSTLDGPPPIAEDGPSDQLVEDQKSYKLAISYLTSADTPPPVRVQGLEFLSKLMESNSSVIDVPALLVLFSSLLQDSEEYIYLRVIQSFTHLSRRHPKSVMRDLIERYVDGSEDSGLDARLRLGEALLQVIQTSTHAFHGDTAQFVCEGLMSVGGRRGRRPRSEEEQRKKAQFKRKRDQEAEEAWDGPVPQLDEVLGNDASQDDELISQIVSGWESKRGTEDVRIRASAIAILGSAIEMNAAGIGSAIIATAVDLSIHIMTLEPEPENGILRRSAILLIMNLAKALESARTEGRKLGFGFVGQSLDEVLRILGYVESTDNDGLVRQHARDVIEGLQAWHINSLVSSNRGEFEMQSLAGLTINQAESSGRPRHRIEEIE